MRQSRGLAGQPILLVEDEARLRDMWQQGTREMGFQPTAVSSAEQALRVLEQQSFPVVIVDLNLPGMGGMDLLQAIRVRWPDMQAIILTGFGDLEAAKQAIHLDVVDFLTKPCALGDLEMALSRAFRRWQQVTPPEASVRIEPPDEETPRGAAPAKNPKSSMAFAPREDSEALSMEEVERRTILAALDKHNGNRAAAAAELGISLRKLYYRLGEYQKKGYIS